MLSTFDSSVGEFVRVGSDPRSQEQPIVSAGEHNGARTGLADEDEVHVKTSGRSFEGGLRVASIHFFFFFSRFLLRRSSL